jgi:hypothetical protein
MKNQRYAAVFVAASLLGCSRSPERIKAPSVDPKSAAETAMTLYDTNHDGKLSEAELAKCPGVLATFAGYDTNKDKSIDTEEFQQHLATLFGKQIGATELGCNVYFQGRPLRGATVVFEPETYLGGEVQIAKGETANSGTAEMGIPPEALPSHLQREKMIQFGTYKVRITHPTTKIPAKYNTETTLGYETMRGNPLVSFKLTN